MLKFTLKTGFIRFDLILKTVILLIVPVAVVAQTPAYTDASQCRNITVDSARLACYDAMAKQSGAATAVKQYQAPQPVQRGNINAQMQEKNRKMREELARLRQEEQAGGGNSDADRINRFGKPEQRIVTNKDGEDVFYDRIESLQKGPDGWLITLASGQVWKELYNRPYNLKEGMQVTISPGALGSYHLSAGNLNRFIYVKRIR